jgi:hypothetical protein
MDFGSGKTGEESSHAIDDDRNAVRRKKTQFHGALWVGIGLNRQAALALVA